MLCKSWFVSKLTSTNNSHSTCGFSPLWGMCVQRLRHSGQGRGRNKDAVCMRCLACREPQSPHEPARVCSSHLLALQTASVRVLLLDWVSPSHTLCTKMGHSSVCVCVSLCVSVHICVHAFVCMCVQGPVGRNYVTETKFRILKRSSVSEACSSQPVC